MGTRILLKSLPGNSTVCGLRHCPISNAVPFSGLLLLRHPQNMYHSPTLYHCYVVCFFFFLGRFAVCDQCILIEDNIRKAGNNVHERATWQKAKTIHREYVSSTACAIYFPVLCNINIQSGCTFVCVLVGTLRKRYVHVSLQPLCT